jgi:hypothetical protein
MYKITIFMRNGGIWVSEVDEANTTATIGQRMTSGGFIVCADSRWGKPRQLIVNLADARSVMLEATESKPQ